MPFVPDSPAATPVARGRFVPDATPKPKEQPYSSTLAAAGDLGATLLSQATVGTVGTSAVGVGSRLLGRDAAADKKAFNDSFVYQPQTRQVQESMKAAGDFMAPVTEPIGRGIAAIDRGIGDVAGPGVQKGVREFFGMGADLAGVTPGVAVAAKGVREVAAMKALETQASKVARTPIAIAEAAGLRISPSSVMTTTNAGNKPSLTARVADTVAGGRSNLGNQRFNKGMVNNIAAQDIGLPERMPLNETSLARARKPHAESFERVRQAIPSQVAPDADLMRDISRAGRGTDSTLRLPASAKASLEDVSVPMTGSQMLDTISDLRKKGFTGLTSDSVDANALGNAQLDLAAALEARLDRQIALDAPQILGEYQIARKGFAKIHAVEAAMVGPDVNHAALQKMAKKTNALDGGLKVIADTATNFPREFNIRSARQDDLSQISLGSLVTPIRALTAAGVGATRGAARSPLLGPKGKLSYYYRDKGDSGLPKRVPPPKRAPMQDNLLAAPDIRLPADPAPRTKRSPPSRPLALPAPGSSGAPSPNAAAGRGEGADLGMTPGAAAAGRQHPGGTPLLGHSQGMTLADSLEAYIAKQEGGIGMDEVVIQPTKRRAFPTVAGKRQRGIAQGPAVGNRENVRGAPGAKERGMALELALQGKKVPQASRTALARAIEKEAAKRTKK